MEVKKAKTDHNCSEEFIYEAVLDDSLLQSLPEIEVFIAEIINKKLTSQIIVTLNRIHPIESLQHLKRVKKNKVLLCLSEGRGEDDILQFFKGLNFDFEGLGNLEICKVACRPPKTRKQFEEANINWPCNFHKDDYLEKVISGENFSSLEKQYNSKWMRVAIEAASRSESDFKDGAVIAFGKDCISVASDSRHINPLCHSAMVAVDLVARSQGGGAYSFSPTDYFNKKAPSSDPSGPYLCTGYNVYLTKEPCTMCAMALIHSRALKVFYLEPDLKNGALGSVTKVHTIKALNHHYEVFKVISR